jgi:hypothetical protein
MRRRSLLGTLAAVATGSVTGCTGLTGPIPERSFEICDTECDWGEKTPDAGGDPIVERFPDNLRIVIYGNMSVGSSSCDRAVLENAEVAEGTLRVTVGVGEKDNNPLGGACTADMGTDKYRATFRFREELPEQVVVEEDAAWDSEPSETPTDG